MGKYKRKKRALSLIKLYKAIVKYILQAVLIVASSIAISSILWALFGTIHWGYGINRLIKIIHYTVPGCKINQIGSFETHGFAVTKKFAIAFQIKNLKVQYRETLDISSKDIEAFISLGELLLPKITISKISGCHITIKTGNNKVNGDKIGYITAMILNGLYNTYQEQDAALIDPIIISFVRSGKHIDNINVTHIGNIERDNKGMVKLIVHYNFQDQKPQFINATYTKRKNSLVCKLFGDHIKLANILNIIYQQIPYNIDLKTINHAKANLIVSRNDVLHTEYDIYLNNASFGIMRSKPMFIKRAYLSGSINKNFRILQTSGDIDVSGLGLFHISNMTTQIFNKKGWFEFECYIPFNVHDAKYNGFESFIGSINHYKTKALHELLKQRQILGKTFKVLNGVYEYKREIIDYRFSIRVQDGELKLPIGKNNILYNINTDVFFHTLGFNTILNNATFEELKIPQINIKLRYKHKDIPANITVAIDALSLSLDEISASNLLSRSRKQAIKSLYLESDITFDAHLFIHTILQSDKPVSIKKDVAVRSKITMNNIHSPYVIGYDKPIKMILTKEFESNSFNADIDVSLIGLDQHGQPINDATDTYNAKLSIDIPDIDTENTRKQKYLGIKIHDILIQDSHQGAIRGSAEFYHHNGAMKSLNGFLQKYHKNNEKWNLGVVLDKRNVYQITMQGRNINLSNLILLMQKRINNISIIKKKSQDSIYNVVQQLIVWYNYYSVKIRFNVDKIILLKQQYLQNTTIALDIMTGLVDNIQANLQLMDNNTNIATMVISNHKSKNNTQIQVHGENPAFIINAIGMTIANALTLNQIDAYISQNYNHNINIIGDGSNVCYDTSVKNKLTKNRKCYKALKLHGQYDNKNHLLELYGTVSTNMIEVGWQYQHNLWQGNSNSIVGPLTPSILAKL